VPRHAVLPVLAHFLLFRTGELDDLPAFLRRAQRISKGAGAPAAAFPSTALGTGETPRCAGLLRHAAYRIILNAFWHQ